MGSALAAGGCRRWFCLRPLPCCTLAAVEEKGRRGSGFFGVAVGGDPDGELVLLVVDGGGALGEGCGGDLGAAFWCWRKRRR